LKSGELFKTGSVGSNPTPSATIETHHDTRSQQHSVRSLRKL
jgi:hypothetical protein